MAETAHEQGATPLESEASWHRRPLAFLETRWFHVWALTFVTAIVLVFAYDWVENDMLVPAILFYSAVSGPLAFGIFVSDRVGIEPGRDGVPPGETISGVVLYGGAAGILFAGVLDQLLIHDPTSSQVLWVGPVEEIAKLLVPVALYLTGRYHSPRAGLTLGLASAAGFATMESMGYGFDAYLGAEGDINGPEATILMRALTTPFTHMAWTGAAASALWLEWRRVGGVRITARGVLALLTVMALHVAYDFLLFGGGEIAWPLYVGAFVAMVLSYALFKVCAREVVPEERSASVPPGWRPRGRLLWSPR